MPKNSPVPIGEGLFFVPMQRNFLFFFGIRIDFYNAL